MKVYLPLQCDEKTVMVTEVWAVPFNCRGLPATFRINPVGMINVATLDVCCFIYQQFEAHVGQECCQSILRFPHVADVEISSDQCWLVHFNEVQKMVNQVLHSAITRSVDVEELNFIELISIFVQKGSLTYLQLMFTYYCKNLKIGLSISVRANSFASSNLDE